MWGKMLLHVCEGEVMALVGKMLKHSKYALSLLWNLWWIPRNVLDGMGCYLLLLSPFHLSFHFTANCPLVDSNGCSHFNVEACVANAAVTWCMSAHSSIACHAHNGLFSLYGKRDTVRSSNIHFIFSLSLSQHAQMAAGIILAHNSPAQPV